MTNVFINYRRRDSDAISHRIYDWLAQQFGSEQVFIDIDHIPPGAEWLPHIKAQIGRASVVLVIMSDRWLTEVAVASVKSRKPVPFCPRLSK